MIAAKDYVERPSLSTFLSGIDQVAAFKTFFSMDPSSGKRYTNPLRKDKNPGCSFFIGSDGVIKLNDFAEGRIYNIVDLLKENKQLSFIEALNLLKENHNSGEACFNSAIFASKKTILQVKIRSYEQHDLDYWARFGITESTLKKFNVFAVSSVYLNKKLVKRSTQKNPIYAYYFPSTGHLKVYRPLTPIQEDKWMGNVNDQDINGLDQLEYFGDNLIITKSLKDVMTLYELGFPAIAPQGENMDIQVNMFSNLFSNIVILYDNDGDFSTTTTRGEKGKGAAQKLAEKYGIPAVFIPDGEPKDISDYYYKHGKDASVCLISTLLKTSYQKI